MTFRCARCDFTGTKGDLALHAIDTLHPLCPSCTRSLPENDPQWACEKCLTHAQATLSGVVMMFLELPTHLGHLQPVSFGTGGGDGRPLPGGAVLVLLSNGSAGLSETGETTHEDDPPSVAYELSWWADQWRETRGEPRVGAMSPARMVMKAAGYLETHARWAANSLHGFVSYLRDLERLHAALERATARDLPTERLNADCLDCGGKLVRKADRVTGLLEDQPASCRDCGETYDGVRYNLALSNAWSARIAGWVPLTDAARISGRSVETVETWAKRGQVDSSCRVADGRKLVWWPDVQARVERASA